MRPEPWRPRSDAAVGASYVCFNRVSSNRGWAGAARKEPGERSVVAVAAGEVGVGYQPGLLALREGPLRTAAVRALPCPPDILLVDATGRDHPRRAGLALHLGAVLGVPSVGVTDRPLLATGDRPADRRGATSGLWLGDELVGHWLRSTPGVRPLAISAGWRTDPDAAVEVVLAAVRRGRRTPQPLREARRAARAARGRAGA